MNLNNVFEKQTHAIWKSLKTWTYPTIKTHVQKGKCSIQIYIKDARNQGKIGSIAQLQSKVQSDAYTHLFIYFWFVLSLLTSWTRMSETVYELPHLVS